MFKTSGGLLSAPLRPTARKGARGRAARAFAPARACLGKLSPRLSRIRIRKRDRKGENWDALRGRPSAQPTLMESGRPGKPGKAGLCKTWQSAFEATLPAIQDACSGLPCTASPIAAFAALRGRAPRFWMQRGRKPRAQSCMDCPAGLNLRCAKIVWLDSCFLVRIRLYGKSGLFCGGVFSVFSPRKSKK